MFRKKERNLEYIKGLEKKGYIDKYLSENGALVASKYMPYLSKDCVRFDSYVWCKNGIACLYRNNELLSVERI